MRVLVDRVKRRSFDERLAVGEAGRERVKRRELAANVDKLADTGQAFIDSMQRRGHGRR
jgi:hypothetical protein